MKAISFLIILYIVMVSSVTITKVIYNISNIQDVKEVEVYTKIVEDAKFIGLDISTDALRFPTVARGGQSATRYVNISSDEDSFVVLEVTGKLKEYIYLSENNFFLKAGEWKKIDVQLTPPKDAPLGEYKGKLRAIFYKP